ncbi:TauD/TfdA family dioxygenase [Streptomyces sp. ACA25]|uniref:TauD/TfdA family dioxygenase n=1 Tax=Streptomyces sp. ACA25 TaxID=3022596 RepID=UPI002307989E|nr:TauD/TfdA family dioxygenase [Streptomyces sp. ACA25]MDB1090335.1 TauD/TfdA family dioxygenase [Streptomyces sp. ACA25]
MEVLSDTAAVNALLVERKALVFRGFGIGPEELEPLMHALLPNRLAYVHGNSPRTKVGDNVYTSTEYPAELTISMHNELSYASQWPERLLFYCQQPPDSGGATPVVDGGRWLAALDREVREAFAQGVRYTQNLHGGFGFGRSWQDTFETSDPAEVERILSTGASQVEWKSDGGLRVTQLRPSTARHPVTGEEVWFNQADQWHLSALDGDTARAMREILPENEIPQSVTFADGTPIPDGHITQIRDRGLAEAVDVDWCQGDLMVIDNVLVGHGRRPFSGPRRILVAMSGAGGTTG